MELNFSFEARDRLGLVLDHATLKEVARFRYDIMVRRLGRDYASADHEAGELSDLLDGCSDLITARDDAGRLIGTIRNTYLRDCAGAHRRDELVRVHRAHRFGDDDGQAAIVSRLVVDRDHAPATTALSLICASYARGLANDIAYCSIHCRPQLVTYFELLGFELSFHDPHPDHLDGQEVAFLSLALDGERIEQVQSPFAPIQRAWRAEKGVAQAGPRAA